MTQDFEAHRLLRNAHGQTVLPALLRRAPVTPWQRETLELPDGDFLVIGHLNAQPAAPKALLLHGLGGGLDSVYLCVTAHQLAARGWHCIGLQQRGAGPEPNRLPRSYNHGASDDIRWMLALVAARYPDALRTAVGWSLGGNVLLKALGELGAEAPIDAAVAVSVPFQLTPCVDHLERGAARAYQRYLLRSLKASLRRKHGPVMVPPGADLAGALAAPNFRAFDNAYTAICNGYANADDYYERAACGQYLSGIRVPTRILHALDDPMMRPDIVPPASALPECVQLDVSAHGGHVGFVSSRGRGASWMWPGMWLESEIPRWLDAQRVKLRPASAQTAAPELPTSASA